MHGFRRAAATLWIQAGVFALVLASLDAAWILLGDHDEDAGTLLRAALTVAGLDGASALAIGAFAVPILAWVAPGWSDPAAALRGVLWPADPARRALAFLRCLAGVVGPLAFVALTFLAATRLHERIRTPALEAAAVSAVALVIGVATLAITRRAVLALHDRIARLAGRSPWSRVLVPPAALGFSLVLLVALALATRSRWAGVVAATDLTPIHLIVTSAVLAVLAGIPVSRRPDRARGRRWPSIALPAALVAAFIATLAWAGSDNAVRLIASERAEVAPWSLALVKRVMDFDRDGLLSFLGEGDCAAFDAERYPGAPEVPDNGVDEDCDGEDLNLRIAEESRRPRWDHPLPVAACPDCHVVLVTLDAVAPARMDLYGHERETMPFLRRLASESAWFRYAYAQGPSTRLALPSLFTSQYDSQIKRSVGARIPLEILPDNLTMAEVLRAHGFRTLAVLPTGYFQKWKGLAQGFDEAIADAAANYKAPAYHNADRVTDVALDAVRRSKGTRLFLWVHYYDPHGPYTHPPKGTRFGTTEKDIYDEELLYTDGEARRLIEGLDAILGKDRTVLIVTADHGESFDEVHPKKHHGLDLHSSVLHVPMMVRAPFLPPRVIETPVTTMDLFPTLVNLFRIEGDFRFEGTSLVPWLFEGDAGREDERIVFHMYYLPENVYHKKARFQQVAVRTSTLSLIHDFRNNTLQLYRYRSDPFETRNLAAVMPEAAEALKGEIIRFMARVGR